MIDIVRGETKVEKISIINQIDSNPVRLETLSFVSIEIYQNLNSFAKINYPNEKLRLGSSPNELVLEVTSEISKLFLPGVVNLRLTLQQPNPDFTANPYAVDVIDYALYKVVERQQNIDSLINLTTVKTSLEGFDLILCSSELLCSSTKLCSGRA